MPLNNYLAILMTCSKHRHEVLSGHAMPSVLQLPVVHHTGMNSSGKWMGCADCL